MNLPDYMQNLSIGGDETDVKFIVEGETIVAHKKIVVRNSAALESMFYGTLKEEEEIIIEDIDVPTFKAFLLFQYTERIDDKSIASVAKLYKCADKYGCQLLMDKCMRLLDDECNFRNEDSNFIDVFMNLREIMATDCFLHDKCVEWFEYNICEFEEAPWLNQFLNLPTESLEFLLKSDELEVKEEVLLKAIVKWGKAQLQSEDCGYETLREVLKPVIENIRFTSISTLQQMQPILDILNADDILPPEIISQIKSCVVGNKDERTKMKASLPFESKPRRINEEKIALIEGNMKANEWSKGKHSGHYYTCNIYDVKNGIHRPHIWSRRVNNRFPFQLAIFNRADKQCIAMGNLSGEFSPDILNFPISRYESSVGVECNKGLIWGDWKSNHMTGCFLGGKYYCIGDESEKTCFVTGETYRRYNCLTFRVDSRDNIPTEIAQLPVSLKGAIAVTCKDVILVFGGVSDGQILDKVYEYNPSNDIWTLRHDFKMPKQLWGISATEYGGDIVICGGFSKSGAQNECYSLNTKDGVWSKLPPMKFARFGHSAVFFDGDVVVLGGKDSNEENQIIKAVEIFNGKEWIEGIPLPKYIKEFAAGVV